jgi:hypothetical protein
MLTLLLGLVLSSCGSGPTHPAVSPSTDAPVVPPSAPASNAASGRQYSKVLVIAEENKTYEQVLNGPDAPYLKRLAAQYADLTSMDAGYPVECPSLGAYLLMTGGTRGGVCDDRNPVKHQLPGPNVFSQVADTHRQWRDYAEAMPANCARTNSGFYLVRHAPVPYYVSEAQRCEQWDVPMGTTTSGALHSDLAAGTLPAYSFLTPDACDDMHGGPGCPHNLIATGDAWLTRWMPQILAGPDYRAGRLIVILTWDEGSTTSNHIPTVVVAPSATHLVVARPMTHCSMLRLTEETLGVPLLRCAQGAPDPRAALHLS